MKKKLDAIDQKEEPALWILYYAYWLEVEGSVTGSVGLEEIDSFIAEAEKLQVTDAIILLKMIRATHLAYAQQDGVEDAFRDALKLCAKPYRVVCLSTIREYSRYLHSIREYARSIQMAEGALIGKQDLPLEIQIEQNLLKNFLAISFGHNGDKERALRLYEEVLAFVNHHKLRYVGSALVYNMADLLYDADRKTFQPRSLELYAQSAEMAFAIDDRLGWAWGLYGQARYHLSKNDLTKALDLVRRSRTIFEENHSAEMQGLTLVLEAQIVQGLNKTSEVISLLEQAQKYVPATNRQDWIEILETRFKTEKSLGQTVKALSTLESIQELKAQVWINEKSSSLAKHQAMANLKVEELRNLSLQNDLELQTARLKDANKIRDLSVGLALASSIILGVLSFIFIQTRKIAREKHRLHGVFENLNEAIFLVGSKRIISHIFSYPSGIFNDISKSSWLGQDISSVFKLDKAISSDQLAIMQETLDLTMNEPVLNWTLNGHQLPQELKLASTICELSWQPIEQAGVVVEILVSLRDVTDKRATEQSLQSVSKRMKAFSEILSTNPVRALKLLSELQSWPLVAGDREISVAADQEKLVAHTYKGISRALGLSSLANAMHELEDLLKVPQNELHSRLSIWRSENFFPLLENYLEIGKISQGLAEESFASIEADIRKVVTERCRFHDLSLQQLAFDDSYIDWSPKQIDVLSRAMVHIISNALDHGFIAPRERGWSPPCVSLRLESLRDAEGHALIRFYDNGFGIDRARIVQKAAQQGLVIQTEEEFQAFIFKPGTSTAPVLSQTSGRGVGMTAVQSLLHDHGGHVRIYSPEQGGTCIEMRLPA